MCTKHRPKILRYLGYFWQCTALAIIRFFGADVKPEALKCKNCGKSIVLKSKLKALAFFLDYLFVLWCAVSPVLLYRSVKSVLLVFLIVISVAVVIILLALAVYVYFYKANKWQLKEDENSIPT